MIAKLGAYGSGEMFVMCPYHAEVSGYLFKMVRRSNDRETTHRGDLKEEFECSSRVKLSIHRSGACQFSGGVSGTVTSGYDNGTPKGLSIKTLVFASRELVPLCSVFVWGLDGFKGMGIRRPKKGDQVLVFHHNAMLDLRVPDKHDGAFSLDVFLIPERYRARTANNHLGVEVRRGSGPVFLHRLRVLDLEIPGFLLGMRASRHRHAYPSASGATISSPPEWVTDSDGNSIPVFIVATSPRIAWEHPPPSLDYEASTVPRQNGTS